MRRISVPFFVAVLIAVATLAGVSSPARAASPKLSVGDPAGDAIDTRASMDILNIAFEVKKVRATDPKPSVIVSMKLAAPPEKQLASYTIWATIPECGEFSVDYAPTTLIKTVPSPRSPADAFICTGSSGATDSLSLFSPKFAVSKDNTMTWTIALDSFPKAARAGGTLTQIHAETQIAEPVEGILGNAALGLPTDDVATDKEFTFA